MFFYFFQSDFEFRIVIMQKLKQSIFQFLRLSFLAIMAISTTAVMILLGAILHIFVKPVNKEIFYKCLYHVNYFGMTRKFLMKYASSYLNNIKILEFVFWIFDTSGSQVYLHCSSKTYQDFGKKHHLIMINHIYDSDFMIFLKLLSHFNLQGNAKGFANYHFENIFLIGFASKLMDFTYIKKTWEENKSIVETAMKKYISYPKNVAIVIAPEGHIFTKSWHATSIELSKSKNLKPYKYHLLPKVKGFNVYAPIIKENQQKISIVNMQIAYNSKTSNLPNILNLLISKPVIAHVYIDIIPNEEFDATEECLYKIFEKKDELQESFIACGNFQNGNNNESMTILKTKLSYKTIIISIIWAILTAAIIIQYHLWLFKSRMIYLMSISIILFLATGNNNNNTIA
jgi:hypothetical protein